jgi:hypothetical protein
MSQEIELSEKEASPMLSALEKIEEQKTKAKKGDD